MLSGCGRLVVVALLLVGSLLVGSPRAASPVAAASPSPTRAVDPVEPSSRRPVSTATVAAVRRIRVLVIPIWFSKGTVGTTDPTQGPAPLPRSRFVRALQSDPSGNDARRWWREASFGQVDLSGSVTPWIRVPLKAPAPTTTGLGTCGRQTYVDAAVAGAAAQGWHVADFDQVVVVASASTCTISGMARTSKDGTTPSSAVTFLHGDDGHDTLVFLLAHELLHNLGLGHANALECTAEGTRVVDAMTPGAHCQHREYEDHTSVMGRLDSGSTPAHHPSAAEKAAVGWISEQAGDVRRLSVASLTTSWSQVALHRSNVRRHGPILLRLVHDVAGGAAGATTVELRGRVDPTGSPAHTFEPFESVWDGPPTAWLDGVSIRSNADLLDATPKTTTWTDATLRRGAGTVITSPGDPDDRPWIGAVEIRTDAVVGDTALVSVRRPPSIDQPREQVQACFRTTDPYPSATTELDLSCATFAPQQRMIVDWGDGSAPSVVGPPLLVAPVLTHTYPSDAARCYTVSLRIDPAGGGPASTVTKTIVRGRDGRPPCLAATAPSGTAVSAGRGGWVASVRMGTHHACGGALVAPRWVVTTRSCYVRGLSLAGLSPIPLDVVVGTTTMGPESSTAEHHGLDPATPTQVSPGGDLVLLHLATAANVAPIAIDPVVPSVGSAATTWGWGDVASGFDAWWPRATQLLASPMVLQPASTCAGIGEDAGSSADLGPTVAGGPVPAWSGMCATPPGTATTGGCAGDLGGPVLGADHDLVGVVEGVPGPGPGGFADGVCGSHVRVIALAPVLPWIVQLP